MSNKHSNRWHGKKGGGGGVQGWRGDGRVEKEEEIQIERQAETEIWGGGEIHTDIKIKVGVCMWVCVREREGE